ncbi:MAG: lipid-A-disaccharide synthase N-terminal domain-containing protein [Candidatus Omnitrophota bacterium]
MIWTIIGSMAATLTMLSFVPQIVKSLKTKSVKDVSFFTLVQFSLGVILWMVYGIYRKDPIIIYANLVSLVTLVILIAMYFKYRKNVEWEKVE